MLKINGVDVNQPSVKYDDMPLDGTNIIEPELKPCPFCGGSAKINEWSEGKGDYYYCVACSDCGAQTRKFLEWDNNTRDSAINAWNIRI